MKKLIIAAAMVALSSTAALADTTQGSASATVIAPISIVHTSGASLNFGSFTAGTGGTISVTAGGVGSDAGGAGASFVTGSTNAADSFAVSGDPTRAFTISTTNGNTLNGPGGASMNFDTTSATSASLSGAGAYTLRVGGSLTVGSAQTAGAYTGSYSATVAYQ